MIYSCDRTRRALGQSSRSVVVRQSSLYLPSFHTLTGLLRGPRPRVLESPQPADRQGTHGLHSRGWLAACRSCMRAPVPCTAQHATQCCPSPSPQSAGHRAAHVVPRVCRAARRQHTSAGPGVRRRRSHAGAARVGRGRGRAAAAARPAAARPAAARPAARPAADEAAAGAATRAAAARGSRQRRVLAARHCGMRPLHPRGVPATGGRPSARLVVSRHRRRLPGGWVLPGLVLAGAAAARAGSSCDEPPSSSSTHTPAGRSFDLCVCSFALHLCDPSCLFITLFQLSSRCRWLAVLAPHKQARWVSWMGGRLGVNSCCSVCAGLTRPAPHVRSCLLPAAAREGGAWVGGGAGAQGGSRARPPLPVAQLGPAAAGVTT